MLPSCRVALVASLCCCLAAGATARAQERTTRLDVTHCYVAEAPTIEFESEYWVRALLMRGTTRAAEPGGPLDGAATRCFGTLARVRGAPLAGGGWCEWATSAEDRLLLRWSIEGGGGHGTSAILGGTGRYRGASGEATFQVFPPIPSLEPGLFRACARSTGEFELP
jgi:hypothetical protein